MMMRLSSICTGTGASLSPRSGLGVWLYCKGVGEKGSRTTGSCGRTAFWGIVSGGFSFGRVGGVFGTHPVHACAGWVPKPPPTLQPKPDTKVAHDSVTPIIGNRRGERADARARRARRSRND